MPKRRLTKEFVDTIEAPPAGELWIADTAAKGFGLRVRRYKGCTKKSYCVRTRRQGNQQTRATYPLEPDPYMAALGEHETLGDHLGRARDWADQLHKATKGQATATESGDEVVYRRLREAVPNFTLEHSANILIKSMNRRGLSPAYVDRCSKLFWNSIPESLRSKRPREIDPRALAATINTLQRRPAAARSLRSFVGQILTALAEFDPKIGRLHRELTTNITIDYENERVWPTDLPTADEIERIVSHLRSRQPARQSISCLLLALEFDVPLSRLLGARWSSIHGDRWIAWAKNERYLHSRVIERDVAAILRELRATSQTGFPLSDFWFPSAASTSGHLTSVADTWKACCCDAIGRLIPLRLAVKSYQRHVATPRRFDRIASCP